MKKLLILAGLFLSFGIVNAQTEEELDALLDEMDADTADVITGERVYQKVDKPPKPRTSMTDFYHVVNEYIKSNYPADAPKKHGRIYVEFVVEKDGELTNFKVSQGLSKALNQVTMDAVKSYGKWIPGENGVVKVRTYFAQPIMIREDLLK